MAIEIYCRRRRIPNGAGGWAARRGHCNRASSEWKGRRRGEYELTEHGAAADIVAGVARGPAAGAAAEGAPVIHDRYYRLPTFMSTVCSNSGLWRSSAHLEKTAYSSGRGRSDVCMPWVSSYKGEL